MGLLSMLSIETGLRAAWDAGYEWGTYLNVEVREHADLWQGVYRKARAPEWAIERAAATGGGWRLLVLSEDWCGDASNTVPVLARFAEAAGVELRILKRDEHLELMDRYLTNGSRSIPIAIVLDEELRPIASWGPRPAELQEFVIREKRAGQRPVEEIYKDTRRWYARDRGETTLRELLERIEAAAGD
ncbi:MAG: thioredoxin family protein [Gemmatimonadota bacterium]